MQLAISMFYDHGRDLDDDFAFDEHLSQGLQIKSAVHFSPVTVARIAARLLAPKPGTRVLDVGSGVGKFCLVAAIANPVSTFVGVEFRPHLASIARRLARELVVPNAQFLNGNAFDLDWNEYDAFYFYNPFAEQLHCVPFLLDYSLELASTNFLEYVSAVRRRLVVAPLGTRVVTYHGFGAPPPYGYDLVSSREHKNLELWVKTKPVFS